MNRSIGNTIGDSLSLSLAYARRMLAGVTPSTFARYAAPGNQVVESNHPAFVYGHLSLYGSRIIEQLGGDASAHKSGAENGYFAYVFVEHIDYLAKICWQRYEK